MGTGTTLLPSLQRTTAGCRSSGALPATLWQALRRQEGSMGRGRQLPPALIQVRCQELLLRRRKAEREAACGRPSRVQHLGIATARVSLAVRAPRQTIEAGKAA